MRRISVDIGGTFTDCFFVWDDTYIESKALTTHHNLALGFNAALDNACTRAGLSREEVLKGVDSVRYATTLGTNALIEGKGPKVGVLVTHGFEDTIHISRSKGYGAGLDPLKQGDMADAERPEPLVPRNLVRSIKERVDSVGEILVPMMDDDVRQQVRELVDEGAEALVIALTNATENSTHEERILEIILEDFPSHELGSIPVLLSSQVSGRKGEYVRASSTIIDGFLHETMFHALNQLSQNLRASGYEKPMLVVHNSGGMAQPNSTDALQTIHSGPIAGVGGAQHLSEVTGLGDVVSMDMGGTSFDIGLVPEGGIQHYDFQPTIGRWLVSVPMIHLNTLGSGGGSIASYDRVHHAVKVGPESAGSDPGPAAYDRGGLRPTVTDADLLLGYLDPDNYANGFIKLNPKRSLFAMEEHIGDYLDLDPIESAKVVKRTVDEQMAIGIEMELRSHGGVVDDYTMLAYGGNGPLHACGIAEKAGIKRILFPPFSSVFSALGAGNMKPLHIHERSSYIVLYDPITRDLFDDYERFNGYVEELEQRGREDLIRQGYDVSKVEHRLEMDMRYGNQLVTTAVSFDINRLNNVGDVLKVIRTFSDIYGDRYGEGTQAPEAGVRVQTVRVASYINGDVVNFESLFFDAERSTPEKVSSRKVHFVGHDEPLETPVYDQTALNEKYVVEGPAIITTESTTYLIEPGWRTEPTPQGAVWLLKGDTRPRGKHNAQPSDASADA
ncbi:hydantoinase/oxoprolinase family protein [Corynebacterium sp. 320]|uniref:Hydantoinase/oxoprolinase family protein n=1 Tax=Corynebacterium zhongnanshanii TaxID=2768834 RepID=A0ABQ6VFD2_9CORY|nr:MULTISPECIES: hydantoinase/oxoprolinase family protein [Corynebacterium]KAB1504119.1 hydantoinase/oxoprolinase family protein [Corynebacterium sp. 320]KAB1552781.1 hydantoinase/oxoprolinase family protein [Corynebacterium sp. 321]KAB1554001.1 hydantoinase/oxoprolinase family protein [Corynebacterium sp. 319]KAB3523028.1 hydantoinase/oxoprolinase family protein [Corynebacterium zhongnanshanii]KAB3528255.1 hydantoinase/oxoprolinase family protein [Corynebacterium sp. 250]